MTMMKPATTTGFDLCGCFVFVFRLKQLTVDDVHMASLCFLVCAINSD